MWYLVYNALLLMAAPGILMTLLAKKRCRRGFRQRFGLHGPNGLNGQNAPNTPVVWIHAVSLGEVMAIVPLVKALQLRYPSSQVVVTTVTDTGREAVEQQLAGLATHRYAPLDFPWAVKRFIRSLDPSLFVFVETELWPNLLRALSQHGVPAVLVNGRLSSRSFRRYRVLRFFFSQVLRHVRLVLVQSDRDGERFISIGAVPSRVIRTGNLKFDQPPPQATANALDRRALGLADQEQLIVAGSTHPGEEEQLLDAYRTLLSSCPSLVLLLAPRHVERAARLEATVKEKGFQVVRRSGLPGTMVSGPRVIVLDTRGELAAVYRHCVVAFVGGTLVPIGGHNLLEPAVWEKAVVFGSHTDHCAEVAERLLQGRGAMRIADGRELASVVAGLLQDTRRLNAMGAAAQQVVLDNRGTVQRTLDLLSTVLQEPSRSPAHPMVHALPREPSEMIR